MLPLLWKIQRKKWALTNIFLFALHRIATEEENFQNHTILLLRWRLRFLFVHLFVQVTVKKHPDKINLWEKGFTFAYSRVLGSSP